MIEYSASDISDDPSELAATMIELVDSSAIHAAGIAIEPPADGTVDELGDIVRRAFDLARHERPDLAVKMGRPPTDRGIAISLLIHEHQWAGGECLRGCGETRDIAQ